MGKPRAFLRNRRPLDAYGARRLLPFQERCKTRRLGGTRHTGGSAGSFTRPAPDILEINEALDHLAKVDERKANVVELRYFGGMDREEIATALQLTVPTVKRDLRLAEAWLRRYLRGDDPA